MQVLNKTSRSIIVFGWNISGGFGQEVIIGPGMAWCVKGPYVGRKDHKKRDEHMDIPGKVTIQETPSGTWRRYCLQEDTKPSISSRKNPEVGITVTYYCPEEE